MKYVFSEEQFHVLMVLAGIKHIYLFQRKDALRDKEIIQAIAGLYFAGCLLEEKGQLTLSKELLTALKDMEEAEFVTKLEFPASYFSPKLIYSGKDGRVVVLEKEQDGNGQVIKFESTERNYYVFDLFENQLLPEGFVKDRNEAESLEKDATADFLEEDDERELMLCVKRIRTEDGMIDSRIDVFPTPVFIWLHIYEGYQNVYHIYSSEEMSDLLLKELKGEEL